MKPQSHNSWNLSQTYQKGRKIIHGNSSILNPRKMELWQSKILLTPSASSFLYREQILQCRLKKQKRPKQKNPIILILDYPFHSLEHWCKVKGFYKASTRLCTRHLSCRHIFAILLKIFRLGSAVLSLILALPYYVSDELCHSTPTEGFSNW